ncbi:MAG: hypothetical protein WC560_11075 [Syntrophales bacterium]
MPNERYPSAIVILLVMDNLNTPTVLSHSMKYPNLGNGMCGADEKGFPFAGIPSFAITKNGYEVMWDNTLHCDQLLTSITLHGLWTRRNV